MNEEQVVVSDDWTKNWQARIAVKTAAIFLWVIIFASFVLLIYITHDLESKINQRLSHDANSLGYRVHRLVSLMPPDVLQENRNALVEAVKDELAQGYFTGVVVNLGDTRVTVGEVTAGLLDQQVRELSYLVPGNPAQTPDQYSIQAYHPSASTLAQDQRERVLTIMVLSILAFGLLLIWTIQNVLARPFQVLMNATRSVSEGKLDLRLDVSRQDEFGHLSRFFNEMLERVQSQQEALTEANRGLTSEVAVRKLAEEELKAHRVRLEQLVEERTRDLEEARDHALQASNTKSAFIANISHEIRTPLTPIIGFAEAMLDGTQSPRQQRESLETIIRNGKHLLSLISEILDLSKIEANRLDMEMVAVNPFQVVRDVESLVGMLAREKGLDFHVGYEFPIPSRITSDPTRLKQILMNLATNAVKFTEKGFVRIDMGYNKEDDALVVKVSDTGIGISTEQRERLFKAFSQADSSTTRQYGGTGLGLYISQRLARLLGGNVVMDSVEGIGSRFLLTVDAGVAGQDDLLVYQESASVDEGPLGQGMPEGLQLQGQVLLAEDNPDNQQLISYYLRRAGADVTVCENGKQAVETAMADVFDLVLMDMQMPVMGGLEAVELLRTTGYDGPIYALTANAMKADLEKYREIGCDGFLSKPVEQGRFYAVLAKHLSHGAGGSLEAAETDAEEDQGPEYQRLVERFVSGLPALANRFEEVLGSRQWDELRVLAHQLKGMGGGFGFPGLTDQAAALESTLRAGDYLESAEQTVEVVEAMRSIHGSGGQVLYQEGSKQG